MIRGKKKIERGTEKENGVYFKPAHFRVGEIQQMLTETLQKIIDNLTTTLVDAEKADAGNNAAGTRVRKAAQQAKTDLQELRVSVQEAKVAAKTA